MNPLRALLALSALAALLPAQTSSVLPPSFAQTEGLGGTSYPFGVGKEVREQLLYETLDPKAAVRGVTEIAMRPDWRGSTYTQGAKAWCHVWVYASHSARGFATMSTTFTANQGPDMAAVIEDRKVALPAQTASATGPLPFNIRLKLDRPFLYRPAIGNLLLEVIVGSQPAGDYRLDSTLHCESRSLDFGARDAACAWPDRTQSPAVPRYPKLDTNLSLKAGGYVDWLLSEAPPSVPALVIMGQDPRYANWGGLKVPVALGAFGAPGCYLNTDLFFATTIPVDAKGSGVGRLPIPLGYALIQEWLHAQAVVFDWAANKMGLVFTLGRKAEVCGPVFATRLVSVGDLEAKTGSLLAGEAPVLELVSR
ncbi:MAG: hypothetical protein R3F30_06900 [Planctomycetota bacterium]